MLIIVLNSLSLWIGISVLLVAWNFDPRSCEIALGLWSLLQFVLALYSLLVQGCDPSVLLDATDGIDSENESPPKESLKGFVDLIDVIKSELEEAHPGVVSCAHVVVFAARESVLLRIYGSQSYNLLCVEQLIWLSHNLILTNWLELSAYFSHMLQFQISGLDAA
ncbi:unnamed protein product [Ilex paraguariensis]|uniref:peroxidase n=1 Tax=Ilex paraguariensis TaxID=185542 RepID=A0ABC8TYN2_9AQUA